MTSGYRPHLLMTLDAVGGVWTYATTLARSLTAHGLKVTLVNLGPRPEPHQFNELANTADVDFIETDLQLEWRDPGGKDLFRARAKLEDLAKQLRPDVVHLNSFREANFAWPAPIVVVAHSCVNTWADACNAHDAFRTSEWDTYSLAIKRSLRSAAVWVAPTATFRDAIMRRYRAPAGAVIHNGIGLPAPAGPKQHSILAAGRVWDRAKNLQALVTAAPLLDWPVEIAGGPAAEVTDHVRWLGVLGHGALLDRMAQAEVFASPALYEPFGLAVLEAAQAGCALVLSDIATFRELWHGAALFVPAEDDIALAAALNRVSHDRRLRLQLQRRARGRSVRYSSARMARAYLELYARLAPHAFDRTIAQPIRPYEEVRA